MPMKLEQKLAPTCAVTMTYSMTPQDQMSACLPSYDSVSSTCIDTSIRLSTPMLRVARSGNEAEMHDFLVQLLHPDGPSATQQRCRRIIAAACDMPHQLDILPSQSLILEGPCTWVCLRQTSTPRKPAALQCDLLLTSGAMYSGVPQAVLHTEPESSSLEYPKSHILMMGSGRLPSSSTLSSCSMPIDAAVRNTLLADEQPVWSLQV